MAFPKIPSDSYLLHPSGSLPYHLRAWLWRRSLWAPFHAEVRRWLTDWRPENSHLVLIGPSGGYALSLQFLERFQHIHVLEPDPLARWILRRRFPQIHFNPQDSRYLARPGGFAQLAENHPDAVFLFCNLLGQELQGQPPGFDRAAWLAELEPALAGRAWASWHDLVSSRRMPERQMHLHLERAQPLETLLAQWWQGGTLEIVDHATTGLCSDAPRNYAIWHLAPHAWHLIEWLAQPCVDGSTQDWPKQL